MQRPIGNVEILCRGKNFLRLTALPYRLFLVFYFIPVLFCFLVGFGIQWAKSYPGKLYKCSAYFPMMNFIRFSFRVL